MFVQTIIAVGLYIIISFVIGVMFNYIFLPKGSTIDDLINPDKKYDLDSCPVVPVFWYTVPGINVLFIITSIMILFDQGFNWCYKRICNNCTFITKLLNKISISWNKFITVKIK